jgi:L-alanine-DL-glutamate epimerase-like enolase superfamily enzyme
VSASTVPTEPPRPKGGGDTIDDVRCQVYTIPTDHAEADGTLSWSSTTLLLVEVVGAGKTGTGWTYADPSGRGLIDGVLSGVVCGADPMDVPGLNEAMVRSCRNLGRPGLASCAISALDIALWDLKARLLGRSLSQLFGSCRSEVPIYGSGGFTTYSDSETTRQLEHWTADLGARSVKIKVGESFGSMSGRDLARAALARRVVGPAVELFVDANGGYTAKNAIRIARPYRDECGISWFEEPVSSDDLAGLRQVRDAIDIDVTAGEYGYQESYFARMLAAGAVDCLQIDVTRCGGYTGWLRVAALAFANEMQISAHCAPSLHLPVAASVPNLRHIEYFHDHVRIEEMIFDGVPQAKDGVLVPDVACEGHGYALREEAAAQYRLH